MPSDPDGGSLCSGQADAGAMLEEERAPSLAQFLVRRLVVEGVEEADDTPVSQDVEETHKFATEAARCRHNQGQESLVAITELIWTIGTALHFRHRSAREHLVGVMVARLAMTEYCRESRDPWTGQR